METIMNGQQSQLNASRRSFFAKTALLFGASAFGSQIASAQQTNLTPPPINDVDILNYALALEHLEAAFYVQVGNRFTASDYANNIYAPIFGSVINSNVASYVAAIRDHELAHVQAIRSLISGLNGTPVSACTYTFGVNDVNDFLSVAMALENTGVMAYDGALALLSNADVKQAAATIATVEARHASYLNVLNGQLPFPSAFDSPKSRAEILAIAARYISSCPGGGPTSNPVGPILRGLNPSVTTIDRDVAFDFSKSTATDGSAVSFLFTQISGNWAGITGQRTSTPTVLLVSGKGVYVFEVVLTDEMGNTQRGRTTVTYN